LGTVDLDQAAREFVATEAEGSTMSEPIKVALDQGRYLLIEAETLGEERVSSRIPNFSEVEATIIEIGQRFERILAGIKPKSASVEFGLKFAMESGQLTALVVKGTGEANLKITLSWS
jgi:hypothetical protein